MPTVKLKNISFNKLKEFTSLGNKKNITIKGKFTLIGEYDVITSDGGDDMTTKEMLKLIMSRLNKIESRLDKLEELVFGIVKVNNLKMPKN